MEAGPKVVDLIRVCGLYAAHCFTYDYLSRSRNRCAELEFKMWHSESKHGQEIICSIRIYFHRLKIC